MYRYTPPSSPLGAVLEAKNHLEIRTDANQEEIIDQFLNGPRKLSNDASSHLIIVERPSNSNSSFTEKEREYDFIFYMTHYTADGLALHQLVNLFFVLLASETPGNPLRSDAEMARLVERQWEAKWAAMEVPGRDSVLPMSTEDRLRSVYRGGESDEDVEDFRRHQAQYVVGPPFFLPIPPTDH